MLPVIITVVKVIQITAKAFVLDFACFRFTQMSFLWVLPPTYQVKINWPYQDERRPKTSILFNTMKAL